MCAEPLAPHEEAAPPQPEALVSLDLSTGSRPRVLQLYSDRLVVNWLGTEVQLPLQQVAKVGLRRQKSLGLLIPGGLVMGLAGAGFFRFQQDPALLLVLFCLAAFAFLWGFLGRWVLVVQVGAVDHVLELPRHHDALYSFLDWLYLAAPPGASPTAWLPFLYAAASAPDRAVAARHALTHHPSQQAWRLDPRPWLAQLQATEVGEPYLPLPQDVVFPEELLGELPQPQGNWTENYQLG